MPREKKDPPNPPKRTSQAVLDRMQDEAIGTTPADRARYKAAHDGMTPIQYALSRFPSAKAQVEKAFPQLAPKKPRKG